MQILLTHEEICDLVTYTREHLDYDYFQDVEIPTIRETQRICTHRFSNINIYVVPKSNRDKNISYITVVPARQKRPSLAEMRRNYCIKVSRNNIELRFNANYFYNDPMEDFIITLFNLLISANKSRILDIREKKMQ
jgi:hypothetical protein